MNAERFSPKQLENQRLFNVGPGAILPEMPGDKAIRVKDKLVTLAVSTGVDLVASGIWEKMMEPRNKQLEQNWATVNAMLNLNLEKNTKQLELVRDQTKQNVKLFAEDYISDEAQALVMNTILQKKTGLHEVNYASPAAKFIFAWTNLFAWTSGKFSGDHVKFWKKPWNYVNPVNVEAAIRLLEEIPYGIGKTVEKVHNNVDKFLSKELVQFVNGAALTVTSAVNITKNMIYGHIKPVKNAQ